MTAEQLRQWASACVGRARQYAEAGAVAGAAYRETVERWNDVVEALLHESSIGDLAVRVADAAYETARQIKRGYTEAQAARDHAHALRFAPELAGIGEKKIAD